MKCQRCGAWPAKRGSKFCGACREALLDAVKKPETALPESPAPAEEGKDHV